MIKGIRESNSELFPSFFGTCFFKIKPKLWYEHETRFKTEINRFPFQHVEAQTWFYDSKVLGGFSNAQSHSRPNIFLGCSAKSQRLDAFPHRAKWRAILNEGRLSIALKTQSLKSPLEKRGSL